jgi:hypothetical protein
MNRESGAESAETNAATELAPQSASSDTVAEPNPASGDAVAAVHAVPPEPASGDTLGLAVVAFESEEEERFFSEPPDLYEDTTTPSVAHDAARVERPAWPDAVTLTQVALQRELHPHPELPPEDPQLRARRRQLRGRVAGLLGAMLLVLLAGLVVRQRSEAAQRMREAVTPSARAIATNTAPFAGSSSPVPAAREESVVPIPPPPVASSDEDSADPPSAEDAAALIRNARTLLSAGRAREGVAAARQAVEKNPLDAEPYVLLAAGLQDLGAWSEARQVFAACRRKAKRGPSSTCQYFARY